MPHTPLIKCSLVLFGILLLLQACTNQPESDLPILGEATKSFEFRNQENSNVTNALFENRIVVADFFFTTCPTICPVMKRQMYRVYKEFENTEDLLLFSHTIDPEHDTVEVLSDYAAKLGINSRRWQLVTGDQDEIFAMAKHYMLGAMKNDEVPGGYIHSGSFVLIDKKKKIRGYYNGTDREEVDQLINDLKILTNGN